MYFLLKIVNNISMLKNSIKFIDEEEQQIEYQNQIEEIDKKIAPFSLMIKNGNYFTYTAVFDNNEEQKLLLENSFHLLVNVKEVGSFHFFFDSKTFQKQEIIDKVLLLKEIENPLEKVDEMFALLKEQNVLFVIYLAKGDKFLSKEQLEKYQENIFYVPKDNEEEKQEIVEEEHKEVKSQKFASKIADFFAPLLEDHIKFLFITIAALIISFAATMAIYYCYAGKTVYYVFFIFTLVGALFNFVIFKDYFKEGKYKYNDGILSALFIAVGYALSVGFYKIFLSLANDVPESLTNTSKPIIYALAIMLGLSVLSIGAALLVKILMPAKKEDN